MSEVMININVVLVYAPDERTPVLVKASRERVQVGVATEYVEHGEVVYRIFDSIGNICEGF